MVVNTCVIAYRINPALLSRTEVTFLYVHNTTRILRHNYLDAKVAPDGARLRVLGVGLAEHDPAGGDDVESLPDHGQAGAGRHVLD